MIVRKIIKTRQTQKIVKRIVMEGTDGEPSNNAAAVESPDVKVTCFT